MRTLFTSQPSLIKPRTLRAIWDKANPPAVAKGIVTAQAHGFGERKSITTSSETVMITYQSSFCVSILGDKRAWRYELRGRGPKLPLPASERRSWKHSGYEPAVALEKLVSLRSR
jgi:hypothetical protein